MSLNVLISISCNDPNVSPAAVTALEKHLTPSGYPNNFVRGYEWGGALGSGYQIKTSWSGGPEPKDIDDVVRILRDLGLHPVEVVTHVLDHAPGFRWDKDDGLRKVA